MTATTERLDPHYADQLDDEDLDYLDPWGYPDQHHHHDTREEDAGDR